MAQGDGRGQACAPTGNVFSQIPTSESPKEGGQPLPYIHRLVPLTSRQIAQCGVSYHDIEGFTLASITTAAILPALVYSIHYLPPIAKRVRSYGRQGQSLGRYIRGQWD